MKIRGNEHKMPSKGHGIISNQVVGTIVDIVFVLNGGRILLMAVLASEFRNALHVIDT